MSSVFGKPDIPAEDPAIAAERAAQEQRAEDDRIRALQGQLSTETQFNSKALGSQSLLAGLSGALARVLSGKTSLLGSG